MNRRCIDDVLPERINSRQLWQRWNEVRQSVIRAHQQLDYRYNTGCTRTHFKAGDLVYYRSHPFSQPAHDFSAKLVPRWMGLYKVERWLTPVTARFMNPNNGHFVTRAHVSLKILLLMLLS